MPKVHSFVSHDLDRLISLFTLDMANVMQISNTVPNCKFLYKDNKKYFFNFAEHPTGENWRMYQKASRSQMPLHQHPSKAKFPSGSKNNQCPIFTSQDLSKIRG